MEYFVQQLIIGITLGSIYGLIAIGYTMVYGIIGMINFAHGDVFMVGGFIALIAFLTLLAIGVTAIPVALFLVLLIAMALTALYGWTVERFAYRPLRHSYRLAPLISAIGMSIILQNYVQIAQGARVKPLPPIVTGSHTLMSSDGFDVELKSTQSSQHQGKPFAVQRFCAVFIASGVGAFEAKRLRMEDAAALETLRIIRSVAQCPLVFDLSVTC